MFRDIRKSFQLLSKKAQDHFKVVLLSVLLINVLDLAAIFALGLIISQIPQNWVADSGETIQKANQIEIWSFEIESSGIFFVFSMMGVVLLFLLRTLLSVMLSRRTFLFLGKKQAEVSSHLLSMMQKANYLWLRRQNWQTLAYVVTDGANASVVSVLGQSANLFSEVTLVILIILFLFTIDFTWTFALIAAAFLLVFSINKLLANRSMYLGQAISDSSVQTRRNASDALSLFRELRLANKENFFIEKFEKSKISGATAYARSTWIQQLPKYVFEMIIVVAAIFTLILATQTQINRTSLLTFLIAITRVLPALARINSLVISIKSGLGSSAIVHATLENLAHQNDLTMSTNTSASPMRITSSPTFLKVENLSFRYDDDQVLLEEIDFEIRPGTVSAFVGPSGAGKSTLIELVAGFYLPTKGQITFDGFPVREYINRNPGSIAYVSQSPHFLASSILENVALGEPNDLIDREYVEFLLDKAGAIQFINDLPDGVDTSLSEGGTRFSGGQRQRIALARALYTKPKFLILDEATSAIDQRTEDLIISRLDSLKSSMSILIIAHRFDTIEFADEVNLLVEGRIIDRGKWREIAIRNQELLSIVDLQP